MPRPKTFDPDAVLDRAAEVFRANGYEATSVQDLVERLGLSRSSLYATFGDKHALYLAALDRYRSAGLRALLTTLRRDGPALDHIRGVFESVVEESLGDRHGCLMTNATVERAPCDTETDRRATESFRAIREAFAEAVARAQEQGTLPAARDAARLGCFLANAYYGLRVAAKTRPDRTTLDAIVAETLSALH